MATISHARSALAWLCAAAATTSLAHYGEVTREGLAHVMSDHNLSDEKHFDFAWKWFCFHTKHRTTMIGFALVAFGFFVNGYVRLLDKCVPFFIWIVPDFMAAGVAFLFVFLDLHNCSSLRLGEDALTIFGYDKKLIELAFRKGRFGRIVDHLWPTFVFAVIGVAFFVSGIWKSFSYGTCPVTRITTAVGL